MASNIPFPISRTERCFHCHTIKDLKQLLKCSGCQIAMYCNKNCQKGDYFSRHKPICKKIAKKRASFENLLEMHEKADGKKYLNDEKLIGKFYHETERIKISGHSIQAPQLMIQERFDQLWEMYNELDQNGKSEFSNLENGLII